MVTSGAVLVGMLVAVVLTMLATAESRVAAVFLGTIGTAYVVFLLAHIAGVL